ncbi:Uncharacterised protein [uncultured Clostridium sp.]|uniref:hypothetical protein n=1 Tax=uncultured Clostridium sp. TaxID=59620 RepID=UPI000820A4CE|nr:hypothetical protein [uncultured Clostridium sp.]SCJ99215.1 Uncharacterised protein [uncultured Clostridium sp.]
MKSLNYCLECKRVFESNERCEFCSSDKIKTLKKGTSVNVIGSKIKGSVFNYKDDLVSLVIVTENKERIIKEYKVNNLKKIL